MCSLISPFCLMVNLISWNFRGTAYRDLLLTLRNWVREHNVHFIVLLEPIISGRRADRVVRRIG